MTNKTKFTSGRSELRHRAEVKLNRKVTKSPTPSTEADTKRLLHELQVHQIELELQNAELQEARNKMETLLENYTDLYDYAPVGYFSIDEQGVILEVNLTGASLLGVERSRLINRSMSAFIAPKTLMIFQAFLKRLFEGHEKQVCVVSLVNKQGANFWADLQAAPVSSVEGTKKRCRVIVSDLTPLKQAEDVLHRMEGLATANRRLKLEIVHREIAEEALKKSGTEALKLQEQLRHLARQLLLAQEEERKRISRELHDEVVQTLVGINVHLASLTVKSPMNLKDLRKNIAQTQQLVRHSVDTVHRFARELRPTVLDDLGLIPAMKSFIKDFTKRTHIPVHFEAFAGVEQLDDTQRTVLYRVIQSALANVGKHSNANEASVSIRDVGGAIRTEIHDNGKAFDAERVLLAKRHKRLGLLGSRERVEMVGGTFGVRSSPGQGTTVCADIPMTSPRVATKASLKTKRTK